MAIYSLSTGKDTIPGTAGDDTVSATSSTLNSGVSLTGDAGTDTLALFGGGTFRVDQLAVFNGFENVTLTNVGDSEADVCLANVPLTVAIRSRECGPMSIRQRRSDGDLCKRFTEQQSFSPRQRGRRGDLSNYGNNGFSTSGQAATIHVAANSSSQIFSASSAS